MNSEEEIMELYSKHGIDGILCAMDIGDGALALVVELEKEIVALKTQAALDAPVVAAAAAAANAILAASVDNGNEAENGEFWKQSLDRKIELIRVVRTRREAMSANTEAQ